MQSGTLVALIDGVRLAEVVETEAETLLSEGYLSYVQAFLKRPPPKLVELQREAPRPQIEKDKRSILNQWLIEVCFELKFLAVTLFTGFDIFERYAATRALKPEEIQMYACASMSIAEKLEEIHTVKLHKYVALGARGYTFSQLVDAECDILSVLEYRVQNLTPIHFYEQKQLHEGSVEWFATRLLMLACPSSAVVGLSAPSLAAAAYDIAHFAVHREPSAAYKQYGVSRVEYASTKSALYRALASVPLENEVFSVATGINPRRKDDDEDAHEVRQESARALFNNVVLLAQTKQT